MEQHLVPLVHIAPENRGGKIRKNGIRAARMADDPRAYEIIEPRSIAPRNIARTKILPKAISWRYWLDTKNKPLLACDCPMCVPRGEVKPRRYRVRVREVISRRELEGEQAADDEV